MTEFGEWHMETYGWVTTMDNCLGDLYRDREKVWNASRAHERERCVEVVYECIPDMTASHFRKFGEDIAKAVGRG